MFLRAVVRANCRGDSLSSADANRKFVITLGEMSAAAPINFFTLWLFLHCFCFYVQVRPSVRCLI